MQPELLYVFAFKASSGVPVDPIFRILTAEQVDRTAAKLMREHQAARIHVYDWQSNGIRMRTARFRDVRRVYWNDRTTFWLLRA